MDTKSRRSAKSSRKSTGRAKRSRSLTPPPGPGGRKKTPRSRRSGKSTGRYSKLRDVEDDETELMDLNAINMGVIAQREIGKGGEVRPHEIYENTQYIPNKELRLLDIPLNSSLTF